MKKFICTICGYVYEEAAGIPEKGIAPGTEWEALPADWVCPLCGAPKSAFKEVTEENASKSEEAAQPDNSAEAAKSGNSTEREESDKGAGSPSYGQSSGQRSEQRGDTAEPQRNSGCQQDGAESLKELSFGELSALCSNLAKGCEKQYLAEEMELFLKLSSYFKEKAALKTEGGEAELLEMVSADLKTGYPNAETAAEEAEDRGAKRALVWSGKVTRMLESLLERVERDEGAFMEHTKVFVCDICGFIYVGDEAPAICPVCKVPSLKIMEIQRR